MPTTNVQRWKMFWRCASLLVAVLLLARLHLLMVRLYDPDEFEHLHVTYSMARGLLPYRDFFEHHGPLTYFLTLPVFLLGSPTPAQLTYQRLVALVFVGITLWFTWRLGRRVFHGRVALWGLLGLLTWPWFVEKSVEWRPDVPAMTFVVAAADLTLSALRKKTYPSQHSWKSRCWPVFWPGFWPGMCLGLALLCTLKVVFLALGIGLGAIFTALARKQPWGGSLCGAIVGALLPWWITAGFFQYHAALIPWFHCTVVLPLTWPAHAPDAHATLTFHLWGLNGWAPAHQTFTLCGVFFAAIRGMRPLGQRRGMALLLCPPLLHLAALPLNPAAYLQYYLLTLPFLMLLAANLFHTSWRAPRKAPGKAPGKAPRTFSTAASWLRLAPWAVLLLAFVLGWWLREGRVPNIIRRADHLAGFVVGAGIIMGMIVPKIGKNLLLLGTLIPALHAITMQHVYWSSKGQRLQLEYVQRLLPNHQPILDGFTGLGCLHPHASYWWWLNQHSIPLLRREGNPRDLAQVLQTRVPALVVYDAGVARLWSMEEIIAAGYRPVARHGDILLLLRHDIPAPVENP